jgi:hypothetical protein
VRLFTYFAFRTVFFAPIARVPRFPPMSPGAVEMAILLYESAGTFAMSAAGFRLVFTPLLPLIVVRSVSPEVSPPFSIVGQGRPRGKRPPGGKAVPNKMGSLLKFDENWPAR